MIPLAVPDIGHRERELVLDAIDSGFVSSIGPFVAEFEQLFAEAVGARFAVACASGTAAIHIGLILLGVGRGDLVAVSDFTFVGSANPVAYLGGELLFIDAEATSWNMDPDLLADELDRRARGGEPLPKAVEVVHALGQPARLAEIISICERHGVSVLEDAAESLGATWSSGPLTGQHTGSVARVGAFSFNGNKIVTTGGGGMLVTDDPELAARAKHLTTQAKLPVMGYLHDEVGYNYRLTNVAAALGVAQIERLPAFVARKRDIAHCYDRAFAATPLELPPRLDGYESTYWLYSVLAPSSTSRDELLARLAVSGVDARALWRPLHAQPPYSRVPRVGGKVCDDLFDRGLSLPSSTQLTEAEQAHVIEAVLGVLH